MLNLTSLINQKIKARLRARAEKRNQVRAKVISSEALADPVVFAEQVFGLRVWKRQREVLHAARDHERVSVRSGHKVSKSTSAAVIGWWYTADPVARPAARAIVTAPTGRQVAEIIWREVVALHARATRRGYRLPKPGKRPGTGVRWGDGREFIGFTIDNSQPEAIAGFSGPFQKFIIDEASGVERPVFEALDGNAAAGATFFLISNPTQTSGAFYDSHQPGSDYHPLHIDSRESPNITGEAVIPGLATQGWVDKMITKYGADSLFVSVRVRGEFPTSGDDEIFGGELVRAAMAFTAEADGPLVAGLDVAAFGGDSSRLAPGRGRRGLPLVVIESGDSPAVAGRTLRALRALRTEEERCRGLVPVVNIDANGVGFGVWSLLAGEGFTWDDEAFEPTAECKAVAVNTGEAADDPESYANLRAELHFTAKERLRDGASLPDDEDLSQDLRAPRYSLDRYNRILVEPKLKIRARLGRSPDAGDATLLRFYEPDVSTPRLPVAHDDVLGTEDFSPFAG